MSDPAPELAADAAEADPETTSGEAGQAEGDGPQQPREAESAEAADAGAPQAAEAPESAADEGVEVPASDGAADAPAAEESQQDPAHADNDEPSYRAPAASQDEAGEDAEAPAGMADATAPEPEADVLDAEDAPPNAEEEAVQLPESYDVEMLRAPLMSGQLPPEALRLTSVNHFVSSRRNNLHFVDASTVLTAVGNTVVLYDLHSGDMTFVPGIDGGGIGAIATHPIEAIVVIAEKCKSRAPNVYIYKYGEGKQLQLYRILRGGTEQAYSAVAFDKAGKQLATVGSAPDYMLTLWNWQTEAVILRSKAFSQEVYNVDFSPYFDGFLNTSGTGHIRFWKMASTFTCLKLVGDLGKFGKVELSDVCAFVEFPDGKVLSGSETGELLLWDGNLIKAVLKREGHGTCHDGNVEVLYHHAESNLIYSAGGDGYIRAWDATKLNDAEPADDEIEMEVRMLSEFKVPGDAHVKTLVPRDKQWLILDERGRLVQAHLPATSPPAPADVRVVTLRRFHAGSVVAMANDPKGHFIVSAGAEGALWTHNIASNEPAAVRRFTTPATTLTALPIAADPDATSYVSGHAGGFVRRVVRCSNGWKLLHASRPHKGDVIAVALSPDASRMVTAGEDQTLFFFDFTADATTPHAFVRLTRSPVALLWQTPGLLVACSDGTVLQVAPPTDHDHTAATTYEADSEVQEYHFQLPRSLWPPPPKIEQPAGGDEAAADGQVPPEKSEADPRWKPDAEDLGPFPIAAMFPKANAPEEFILCFEGKHCEHLFVCRFDAPSNVSVLPGMSAGVSSMSHSADGKQIALGSRDGAVRLCPLAEPHTLPDGSESYWQAQVHDMHVAVTGVAISFDGTSLTTAAGDGSMFTFAICGSDGALQAGTPKEGRSNADLPAVNGSEAEDMLDVNAYTIEEAKQKLEEDALKAAAEEKKMTVRQMLDQIRKDFKALLAENEAKPEPERLPRSYFDIDPDMRAMIEEEIKEAERVAHMEMRWESEKQAIALKKIKARFLDDLEVERIVLYAINSSAKLTSFRTAKLPPWVLSELQAIATLEDTADDGEADAAEGSAVDSGAKADGILDQTILHKTVSRRKTNKGQSKIEMRKAARLKRQEEWEAFLKTKPDDNYHNPDDVKAIQDAERDMGDFKLKSDPDYVPPEDQRMTPQRKKQQIALLEEGLYRVKMGFNERFLSLREVKRTVCQRLGLKVKALADVNSQLGLTESLPNPRMQQDEEPESREIVTEEDVEAYLQTIKAEEASKAKGGGGGFGGFGGGGASNKDADKGDTGKGKGKGADDGAKGDGERRAPGSRQAESPEDVLARVVANTPMSDLEKLEHELRQRKLHTQRTRLKEEINGMIESFDTALDALRAEKFTLETDVKAAEVRRLVMWKEYMLLVDFSKKDDILAGKLAEKHSEHKEIMKRMGGCQQQLKDFKTQLDAVAKKKAEITSNLEKAVDENHPHHEALLTIFNRKLKRSKKSPDGEEDEDSEEDDDDDDFDEDDDQQEVCPPGCEQALYDEVCALRELRLDQEDNIAEITKGSDQVKKEQESLKQKLKRIEQSVAATESDIEEFQKEKQASLNEIQVMVVMHAHQIEYLVEQCLPADLSAALVFSDTELKRLRRRIDELAIEKNNMRKKQRDLKRQHLQLTRDKQSKEAHLAELDRRAHDVQMLKFGRVIDLELLEKLGPSPGADDLRAQLRSQEHGFMSELAEWDRKIAARTEELVALTQENTTHLHTVAELTAQQKALEVSVRRTQQELHSDPIASRRREVAERDHLVQMVNAQAKEIEYLKSQITILRRKDTSVYG